jgi:hypothetical protein
MNDKENPVNHAKRTLVAALGLTVLLSACSSGSNPASPGAPASSDPGPWQRTGLQARACAEPSPGNARRRAAVDRTASRRGRGAGSKGVSLDACDVAQ